MAGASTSLKNNRSLKRKKVFFKKGKSFFERQRSYVKNEEGEFAFKKVSKKELSLIKAKIVIQGNKQKTKLLLCFTLLAIIFISLGLKFHNVQKNIESKQSLKKQELYYQEHINKFNYLLLSGDEWLLKRKYHNAIFQYKLALEIFPNDSLANYRLLSAYDIRCQNKGKDCDKKDVLLSKLLN